MKLDLVRISLCYYVRRLQVVLLVVMVGFFPKGAEAWFLSIVRSVILAWCSLNTALYEGPEPYGSKACTMALRASQRVCHSCLVLRVILCMVGRLAR